MNTENRIALLAGLVSLLATVAGCARPDATPAAASPRPVVAYGVSADRVAAPKAASDHAARFEAAPSPQPRVGLIGRGGFGVSPVTSP